MKKIHLTGIQYAFLSQGQGSKTQRPRGHDLQKVLKKVICKNAKKKTLLKEVSTLTRVIPQNA